MRTGLKPPTFSTIYFASKLSISTRERHELREESREAALLSFPSRTLSCRLSRAARDFWPNGELARRLSTIKL